VDLVGADRTLGRRGVDGARPQVELRGVQRAFDLAALQPAVGERGVLMGAGVVDGEDLAVVGVEHRDRRIDVEPVGLASRKIHETARGNHHDTSVRIAKRIALNATSV
jgi:hypothetical protein